MLNKEKVKLGIAPIAWTNDDMPDLGAENTFEQCVSEMALAGFTGSEVGSKYPKDAAVLTRLFRRNTCLFQFPQKCLIEISGGKFLRELQEKAVIDADDFNLNVKYIGVRQAVDLADIGIQRTETPAVGIGNAGSRP